MSNDREPPPPPPRLRRPADITRGQSRADEDTEALRQPSRPLGPLTSHQSAQVGPGDGSANGPGKPKAAGV